MGLGGENHWGDFSGKHQDLRLSYLNIQKFPSNVTDHKNGSIIQMMNDNHIDFLGMSEMNKYWPSYSTPYQIQESTR